MDDDNKERDFHHPYEPYDIQKEFMHAVYQCLETGKVGIFESPTGTGKSLSLICGSLTWLRDNKRRTFEDGFVPDATAGDEPDWILEHAQKEKRAEALRRKRDLNDRIAKVKAKEKRAKERYENKEPHFKRQKVADSAKSSADDEAQFVLDDYESDSEHKKAWKSATFDDTGLSAETQALMEQLGYSAGTSKSNDGDLPDETRIFFCSRTHSQLTQFSRELTRVKMPPALALGENDVDIDVLVEDAKHLTLGSRKNLCINSKVNRLGNATAINERCVELQQSSSADSRCPHMPKKEDEPLLHEFRDHALAKVRDIEDLGSLGKKLGICPYYASRPVVQYCEKSAREALGLSLKNHVVIIDEAHNLMDAIAGIYSAAVTLDQVQQARAQLTVYLQKFRNKLKGKNRVYVAQTIRILDSILSYLVTIQEDSTSTDGLVDMLSIMSGKGVDQVNIFKLNVYLQESRLARKVDGYTTYTEATANEPTPGQKRTLDKSPRQNVPVLMHVQTFLLSLMNPSAEGRFFYSKEDASVTLRYMLLDPTFHFQDIVEEARAVVLAGGTMSPMSDYEQHLLAYLEPSRIMTLSCGHVIPPSNLLAVPIVRASSGNELDFTFESRNKEKTIIDLGRAILAVAQHIPDGVVVFFPSYSYLDTCITAWKRNAMLGSKNTFWERFTQVKPIFLEQRSQHNVSQPTSTKEAAVDSVLTAYSAAIASGKGRGALLFAVIGGTLSEGINFSDALGRGVVVVGLPFPNPHSAQWKAKMQYISAKETERGGDGKAAARDFFENACMRAVNQCVGRAIRHKGDYAAIMMLDRRYGTKRIQDKLPKWIRGRETMAPPPSSSLGAYTTVAQTDEGDPNSTHHRPSISSSTHSNTEGPTLPSPTDLCSLPQISAPLPLPAYLIATVELCERFAYYGLSGPFQNYISASPTSSPAGVLGLGQARATALTNLFQFWCYVTPLVGAVVADEYMGKFGAIRCFSAIYMLGIVVLFLSSLQLVQGTAMAGLVVAMAVIGLGTGGIKPNVSPFIAEQVAFEADYVAANTRTGRREVVSHALTMQKVFSVFYICINIGSVGAMLTTLLELHVGFWAAYGLPLVVFMLGFGILVRFKEQYIIKPPQGGVLRDCLSILYIAARHGFALDAARGQGRWADDFIDELRTALRACKIFMFYPVYWLAFSQMLNNFVSQASLLSLHHIPNDLLPTLNPLSLLLLIPLFTHALYPLLHNPPPYPRIAAGFVLAAMAMFYASILQYFISTRPPRSIHVAYQAPAYVLIAASEICASITGLEVAYARAPMGLKSVVMSLYLGTSAMGSVLGVLVAPLAGREEWVGGMYAGLGVVVGLAGGVFWWMFRDDETLGARVLRRAIGLSSMALSPSASSSAIGACRLEAGVDERGVDRIGSLPLAGVEGDCIGLARGRFDCCMGVVDAGRLVCCSGVVEAGRRGAWCEGVVDAGRIDGGGDRADRPNGLRTGIDDPLDMRLSERGEVYGDGVVRLSGLKLWPTTVSRMLTLEFQRGLTAGLSDLGVVERIDAEVMARGAFVA
ncbi:helicase C-terminal domain-containing protein [Phaeosphaeria sp. MPI-PUGE-AT-0046c]|nr:helicase C-terminal domain-containing protein [Phaeosphaeria sp. MPI-PUGE-AT-0046c]